MDTSQGSTWLGPSLPHKKYTRTKEADNKNTLAYCTNVLFTVVKSFIRQVPILVTCESLARFLIIGTWYLTIFIGSFVYLKPDIFCNGGGGNGAEHSKMCFYALML